MGKVSLPGDEMYNIIYYTFPVDYRIEISGFVHMNDIDKFCNQLRQARANILIDEKLEEKERRQTETRWLCERCNKTGCVTMKPHEDIISVFYKIEDDHKAKSPNCEMPIRGLRIIR